MSVEKVKEDQYELVDLEGDPFVLHLPNPVPPEVVVFIFRRYGEMHRFLITDLASRRKH